MTQRQSMADSDLLAEALKQMDDILADTVSLKSATLPAGAGLKNGYRHHYTPSSLTSSSSSNHHGTGPVHLTNGQLKMVTTSDVYVGRAVRLLNDLYVTLGLVEDKRNVINQLYPDAQNFFSKWMSAGGANKNVDAGLTNNTRSTGSGSMPDSQKLDLLAENSNLRVRLARTEKDLLETEEKLGDAQLKINELQSRLNDRTIEVSELRSRLARSEPSSPDRSLSNSFRERTIEREKTIERLKRKHFEVEKLKQAVESLMATNEEKDSRIEELRVLLRRYRKLEELASKSQVLEQLGLDADNISDGSSAHNSNTSSNDNALSDNRTSYDRSDLRDYPFSAGNALLPYPSATSTPVRGNAVTSSLPRAHMNGSQSGISPLNQPSTLPVPVRPSTAGSSAGGRSTSFDNVSASHIMISKTPPPTLRRRIDPHASRRGWFSDDDDLGRADTDDETLKDEMAQQYKALQDQHGDYNASFRKKSSSRGFKRFFGKMKRTSSQELSDKMEEFKRAGFRSTAGARLGWSKDLNELDLPFARWDTDRIALWLHMQGLSMYVGDCKRWVKNGEQLVSATTHDLEKELGMRNYFHRKKLQLALQDITTQKKSPAAELDYNWVTRWLDDIGLPQYKDQFTDARVDGRMLNYLTVDDLIALKVINTLHHLSIRRGIQVLRANNFIATCLKRRPAPDEGVLHNCPEEVSVWSNHRVMEWLRTIDLSEYAPNLRGSGVHGGVMVHEPRFGAEIFASILSIPANKTLLRRHLSTHFVTLVGGAVQQQKRIVETQPGYLPLTLSQKVKIKKGLFRNIKGDDKEDFVCPFDGDDFTVFRSKSSSVSSSIKLNGMGRGSEGSDLRGSHAKIAAEIIHREDDEHLLAQDKRYLENVPTSDV